MRRTTLLLMSMLVMLVVGTGVALAALQANGSFTGTNTANSIDGSSNADRIAGGGGGDTIAGNQNDDTLFGDHGGDTLKGNSGADFINAADNRSGNDNVIGGEGGTDNDTCIVDENDKVDGTAVAAGLTNSGSCEVLVVIP